MYASTATQVVNLSCCGCMPAAGSMSHPSSSTCVRRQSDPLNAVGMSADDVRATYGQEPPQSVDDPEVPGVWSLAQQCNYEIASATASTSGE